MFFLFLPHFEATVFHFLAASRGHSQGNDAATEGLPRSGSFDSLSKFAFIFALSNDGPGHIDAVADTLRVL